MEILGVSRRRFVGRVTRLGLSVLGLLALDGGRMGAGVAMAQMLPEPTELYRRLLGTPFQSGELPPGFAVNPPMNQPAGSGMQPVHPDLPGLTSALVAELRGPDLTNVIWYYLFASEADALDHFENGDWGRTTTSSGPADTSQLPSGAPPVAGSADSTLTEAYTPADVDQPAWCVAAKLGPWGWTSCTILVENVEAVGYSKARPGTGANRGNDANAIALARAAVAHLTRLA
jgi:hypothetical protein